MTLRMSRAVSAVSPTQVAVRALVLIVAYCVTAKLGLSVHAVGGFATLIWVPTGLALAGLLIWGQAMWPAIAVAAFAVNLLSGAPAMVALGIAAGNTLEAVTGATLLKHAGFDARLVRVRDVIKLVVLAAGLSTIVSATFGVASLWAGGVIGQAEVGAAWRAWWLGDSLGALVFTPLLLVWHAHPRAQITRLKLLEGAAMVVALAATLGILFSVERSHPLGKADVLYPALIWGALRFGQRGAVTLLVLVSSAMLAGTILEVGPFVEMTLAESLISQQGFTGITSIAILILAAAITERNTAIRASNARADASKFLADAGRLLSGSLDYAVTLQNVAQLVVPRLADNCVIDVVHGTEVRRMGEAAADPAKLSLLRQLRDFPVNKSRPTPVLKVLESGQTVFIPKFDLEAMRKGASTDAYLEIVRQIGPSSSVTVPMMAGLKIVGTMTFGMAESNRTYAPEDIALAEELGARAGLATENARLYAEAQAAVRMRDEFLAVAAHELRTPLTALELQVGVLSRLGARDGSIPSASFGPRIEMLTRQLDRFTALIDNLLDVSRVSDGRLSLEPEDVELVQLVRDVALRFEEQAERAASPIAITTGQDVIVGRWDRLRLDQMITNLLSNAVKYGAGGAIAVKLGCDPQSASLIVIDKGIGIRAEDHARIFDRFERAASPKNFGGLGLGLWIVKEIATGMGGTIEVDSQPNEGAAFTLRLPRHQ
jgi:signal transduction histidine kinase/integral membrane sensor domain MASE1